MNNPYTSPNASIDKTSDMPNRKKRIKRFSPIQLGKVMAVVSFCMSLLFVPILILVAALGPAKNAGSAMPMLIMLPII